MKKQNSLKPSRVADAIVFSLKQADTGVAVADVCRKIGISSTAAAMARHWPPGFYNWNRIAEAKKIWRLSYTVKSQVKPQLILGIFVKKPYHFDC